MECIKSILLRDNINDVVLDLSYNCLRWLPDELFSIKEITLLNLMNNLLCYLPEAIENTRDHLTSLQLGNYDSFNPLLTNRHSRRTSGNIFKMVPLAIFKLNKLTDLDMKSVQLGEFPESELYEALPMLSALNVAHNDLSSVPESNFQDRHLIVISHDNPGSPPITLYQRIGDRCFDIGARYVNLPSTAMNFFSRHPVGCVFGFIALWPTVFIGTLYLEHGSLLWGGAGVSR